jgi:hypothetical protein
MDDNLRNERFKYVCVELLKGGMRIGRHARIIAEKTSKDATIEEVVQGKK